jgi:hypothetical protein
LPFPTLKARTIAMPNVGSCCAEIAVSVHE